MFINFYPQGESHDYLRPARSMIHLSKLFILEFPINIPTKGVYELMSTSFDKKEVDEQLHDFIVDQLDEDEITDYLFDSIKSLIESKYKAE